MQADATREPQDPVDALAAEYVERRHAGEDADFAAYLKRLATLEQQRRFRELVDGVARVAALMPRQIRPGATVSGRYHVRKEIGQGGMGRVYEAFDEQLQRSVALKVLDFAAAQKLEFATMFERESRALAAMQHPNIVAVHEAHRDGEASYIVMDLVDGKGLKDVLTCLATRFGRGRPPAAGSALDAAIALPLPAGGAALIDPTSYVRSVVRIAAQVARSLEAAHARGVLHRDLKPSNVLLRGGGQPVLLDFGLAGWQDGDRSDAADGLFGTCAYLAPEQIQHSRTGADPRADLYQLGLLLYEMLTLQRAFPGDEIQELMKDIVDGRFERPRAIVHHLPRDLEAIVMKAVERDPRARYATVREFREDLERFLAGNEAPLAARGGVIAMIVGDARYAMKRQRLIVGAVAAFVIGSLAVWMLVDRTERPAVRFFVKLQNGDSRRVENGDAVRAGDIIVAQVTSEKPVVAYALSQFGAADPSERLVPLWLDQEVDEAGELGRKFRRDVPVGDPGFGCSQIDASDLEAHPDRKFEGVRIFIADAPSPSMQRWLATMAIRSNAAGGAGMTRDEAIELLRSKAGTTRGKTIDAEEAAQFEAVKFDIAAALAREDEREIMLFPGTKTVTLTLRVDRGAP